MILYPAIDLMGGKCVRLEQGKRERCTVYSGHPKEWALRWTGMGAKWLHVVDLDAAIDQNCFANREAVRAILAAVDVPIQLGGGIRTADQIRQYLDDGVARLIVGTSVLESREFARSIFSEFGDRVAVSIDSSGGKVAVKGWTSITDMNTKDVAKRMRDDGAKRIILTDIKRDGMLTEPNYKDIGATAGTMWPITDTETDKLGNWVLLSAPNFDMTSKVAVTAGVKIIAAGGVTLVEHIERLVALRRRNIEGAIIGKALYSGYFDLKAAIEKFPQAEA